MPSAQYPKHRGQSSIATLPFKPPTRPVRLRLDFLFSGATIHPIQELFDLFLQRFRQHKSRDLSKSCKREAGLARSCFTKTPNGGKQPFGAMPKLFWLSGWSVVTPTGISSSASAGSQSFFGDSACHRHQHPSNLPQQRALSNKRLRCPCTWCPRSMRMLRPSPLKGLALISKTHFCRKEAAQRWILMNPRRCGTHVALRLVHQFQAVGCWPRLASNNRPAEPKRDGITYV